MSKISDFKKYGILEKNTNDHDIKLCVFDIETYDEKTKSTWLNPYALGFYDGVSQIKFKGRNCVYEFINYVCGKERYRACSIYAHNGGKFDFNFILEELRKLDYGFEIITQGSRIIELKIFTDKSGSGLHEKGELRKAYNNIKLIDSYALLKSSLDKLTKDFDVEHKKINFMDKPNTKNDYEYLYHLFKIGDPLFDEYLMNDCIGLYEVLKKFFKLIKDNGGKIGITTASTAMKTFQKSYIGDYKLKMSGIKINDIMRKGYYGGRTEIYRMYAKEGNYYWFDINSLYPFVMRNNSFPISPPRKVRDIKKQYIYDYDGITECKITVPKSEYLPLLPYRGDKLYFPVGKISGYYDNSFIRKSYDLGYDIKLYSGYIFYESEQIFKKYVDTFNELKKKAKSNTPSYVLAKLMMNSLYGKFGQREIGENIKRLLPNELMEYKDKILDVINIDENIYRIKSDVKGNHFLPQIAVHVTTLAQLELFNTMHDIVEKGYKIFYCDTDSVATDYKNIRCSNNLGDWKKEHTFYKGYFLLPKTYYIVLKDDKGKVRAKGYRSEFQKGFNESTFKNALFKNDYSGFVIHAENRFLPFLTSYKRFGSFVSVAPLNKSIKSLYGKRTIIDKINYNTFPINVNSV